LQPVRRPLASTEKEEKKRDEDVSDEEELEGVE
jgi:hypothetical protein